MTLKAEHIRVDISTIGGPVNNPDYEIKMTHMPTGISVSARCGQGYKYHSQLQAKSAMILALTDEVMERRIKEWHDADTSQQVHEYLGISWESYAAWVEDREERESFDTIGTISHPAFDHPQDDG